jgi:hypothetical protein
MSWRCLSSEDDICRGEADPEASDCAMVKALARAFRRRKMLDEGAHATLEARAKDVAPSYVSQVLRLTLLVYRGTDLRQRFAPVTPPV